MNAHDLYLEAVRRGLRLEPAGHFKRTQVERDGFKRSDQERGHVVRIGDPRKFRRTACPRSKLRTAGFRSADIVSASAISANFRTLDIERLFAGVKDK